MNPPPKCPFCQDTRQVRYAQPSPPGWYWDFCPACSAWLRGEAGESLVAHPRDPNSASEDSGIVKDQNL